MSINHRLENPGFNIPSRRSELRESEDPKEKQKLMRRVGLATLATAAGAATIIGITVGVTNANAGGEKEPQTNSAPINSAEPTAEPTFEQTPEPTPETAEQEYTVEALSFNPEGTPEEWAQHYVELMDMWSNAGATEETYERGLNSTVTASEFAFQEASTYSDAFAEALYGPDWRSNEKRVAFVEALQNENAVTLLGYFATKRDDVRYETTQTLVSTEVISEEGNTVLTHTTFDHTQNAAENSFGEKQPAMLERNAKDRITVELTYTTENGKTFISGYNMLSTEQVVR